MISSSMNAGSTEKMRSQWLKDVSAYLVDGYEVAEYGKTRIKIALFTDKEAPLAVLSHVWHEYDIYGEATLKWLYELGDHPDSEVRLRAAAVAGQLAVYEFRPVHEKILLPWAKSANRSVQRLAALALAVVAYDENEEISQQALNLLHHWSGLQNSPRLHWTSVAAYGGYIGLLFPQEALDNLRLIAQSGDGQLFASIAQAVASLFEAGQQVSNKHLLVLGTLKIWMEQDHKTAIHKLSILIFWGLVRESWLIKDDIPQPTLLWLSKQNQDVEDIIICLMRNSLNQEFSRDLILPEILNWLKFVDRQQSLYKALARILFTLASPGKERERICSYLRRWSKDSKSAIRVMNLIQQKS